MPGYIVFPGGITEISDELPENHKLLPSPLPVRKISKKVDQILKYIFFLEHFKGF